MGALKPNRFLATVGLATLVSSLFLAALKVAEPVTLAFLFAAVVFTIVSVLEPRLEGLQRISLTETTLNVARNPALRRSNEAADVAAKTGLAQSAREVGQGAKRGRPQSAREAGQVSVSYDSIRLAPQAVTDYQELAHPAKKRAFDTFVDALGALHTRTPLPEDVEVVESDEFGGWALMRVGGILFAFRALTPTESASFGHRTPMYLVSTIRRFGDLTWTRAMDDGDGLPNAE